MNTIMTWVNAPFVRAGSVHVEMYRLFVKWGGRWGDSNFHADDQ